jgi:cytoskeletal protein RodZ
MARGNFGERLKREREMREVSLDEITVATRIGTRFLGALENEEWGKLPGGVFNRGFIRAIARFLGLDEEDLLAEYDVAYSVRADARPASPPPQRTAAFASRVFPALAVVLVLFGLVVGGYYGWRRLRALQRAPEAAAVPVPAPAPAEQPGSVSASAPVTASPRTTDPSERLDLSISASHSVQIRVTADGKEAFEGEIAAGQTLHFYAQDEFVVSAGNSTAVLLELNGQAMPPIGAPGSSGKIVLTRKDLNRASDGNIQP